MDYATSTHDDDPPDAAWEIRFPISLLNLLLRCRRARYPFADMRIFRAMLGGSGSLFQSISKRDERSARRGKPTWVWTVLLVCMALIHEGGRRTLTTFSVFFTR